MPSVVVRTPPSSAWLSTERPSGATRTPTTPWPACPGTGWARLSLARGSQAARPPSLWPTTMTPELGCAPPAVTAALAGTDLSVCPLSRSQSFTVRSALVVKAWEPPRRKPQALRAPRCPRSACNSRWARRSSSRRAWSADAASSMPVPGERSTATRRGKSLETERCACSRAVSPSRSLTYPSAVPTATSERGSGALCMPAAAMQVSSAPWILRKTRCRAGIAGASTPTRPPRPTLCCAASASRERCSSAISRSASAVFACSCSCVRTSWDCSSAFSRLRSVACREAAACACSFSRNSSSRSLSTSWRASSSCSFIRSPYSSWLASCAPAAAAGCSSSRPSVVGSAGAAPGSRPRAACSSRRVSA
mmetsp:Transcript_117538/g.379318  ORF Transcript_117538/g.379318 Transcript_117538/m.379318 type:complete len:365 (-) Transcript_117538:56-1150(-)